MENNGGFMTAVRFRQADGSISDTVRPLSAARISSATTFLPSEAEAPSAATVNGIVIYDNFDGDHHILKDVGGVTLGADGAMSGEVTFNQIIDLSTKSAIQVVDAPAGTAEVTIDLAQGQVIELMHDENITITFTNVPVGFITPVAIVRIKGNNTTPRTIGFTGTLLTEGCQKLVFSSVANSISALFLYMDGSGIIVSRLPINNFGLSAGQIQILSDQGSFIQQRAVRSITEGTIVTLTNSGALLSTDVEWDGSTFTSPVYSSKNTIKLCYYAYQSKTSTTGETDIVLDCNEGVFSTLVMNENVTSLDIINIPLATGIIYTAFVQHADDAVSRDITWGLDYKYDTRPTLTQTANALDILVITTLDGTAKLVQCFQNFGVPV